MRCPLLISSRSHPCVGLPLPDQHIGRPKLMDDLLGRMSLLRHPLCPQSLERKHWVMLFLVGYKNRFSNEVFNALPSLVLRQFAS